MSNTYNALIHAKQDGTGEEVANNLSGGGGSDLSDYAKQKELSNLVLTGATNTSGATISAGTCFVLNGDFVVAKTDIASDATFTLNTNYEKKSVGSILTELNSKTTYISANATITPAMSGRFKLYKQNKTVTAEIRFSTDSSYIPTVGQKIGTIPTGYAPTTSVIFELIHAGDNALSKIELKSDGGIYSLSTGIDFQNWMTGQVTYYVG